jgi:hypothetical protein
MQGGDVDDQVAFLRLRLIAEKFPSTADNSEFRFLVMPT